jgi:hypothetical protein
MNLPLERPKLEDFEFADDVFGGSSRNREWRLTLRTEAAVEVSAVGEADDAARAMGWRPKVKAEFLSSPRLGVQNYAFSHRNRQR